MSDPKSGTFSTAPHRLCERVKGTSATHTDSIRLYPTGLVSPEETKGEEPRGELCLASSMTAGLGLSLRG